MEVYEMAAQVTPQDLSCHRYGMDKYIEEVLDAIQDGEITDAASDAGTEGCSSLVDVYTADLIAWRDASRDHEAYIQRAIEGGLIDTTEYDEWAWLSVAQEEFYRDVMADVIADLEDLILDLPPEPEEEDYVLQPSGPLGSRTTLSIAGGEYIGEYNSDDEALEEVIRRMDEERYYPAVWRISDHGNPIELEV